MGEIKVLNSVLIREGSALIMKSKPVRVLTEKRKLSHNELLSDFDSLNGIRGTFEKAFQINVA